MKDPVISSAAGYANAVRMRHRRLKRHRLSRPTIDSYLHIISIICKVHTRYLGDLPSDLDIGMDFFISRAGKIVPVKLLLLQDPLYS